MTDTVAVVVGIATAIESVLWLQIFPRVFGTVADHIVCVCTLDCVYTVDGYFHYEMSHQR